MPLTARQVRTLRLIADRQITGRIDENGFPCFSDGSAACTGTVMSLSAKALVILAITKDAAGVALNERPKGFVQGVLRCLARSQFTPMRRQTIAAP